MRSYDLSLGKVKQIILSANQEVGGSVLELGEAEYMIRGKGYIKNLEDLRKIPYVGKRQAGATLTVNDFAKVRLGPQARRGVSDFNGEGEVVGGTIVMSSGSNAQTTIDAVKAKLEELKKGLPEGVELVTVYDRSSLIQRAVSTLKNRLLEEFLLVALVCMLFLWHFRSSLVIIFSLPVGILIAFIIMYSQNINANIMSLGGIAIAIGAMVDASIVMIENVHKHLEKGFENTQQRLEVIKQALSEVSSPLFYSLLIIAISFLPILVLEAQEGKLFAPLAFTKTYAMAAAAGLSITLVPALIALFIRGKVRKEKHSTLSRALVAIYKPAIDFTLKHPLILILFIIEHSLINKYN
jgi:Cu(I)/Ag(I) efflux system membrane protein CusA/SilA